MRSSGRSGRGGCRERVMRDCRDSSCLRDSLSAFMPIVPPRARGRTKRHTEPWIVSSLIATLASADSIAFPIDLSWGDKPDFVLAMDGDPIGIEVTEAIPSSYAHYAALASREFPGAMMEPSLFRYDQEPMDATEMRSFLSSRRLQSPGWTGDECEINWSRWVNDSIVAKLNCIGGEDFEVYPKNWLAIYDNLPLVGVDVSRAVSMLESTMDKLWAREPSFDEVFIHCATVLVRLNPRGWDLLPIVVPRSASATGNEREDVIDHGGRPGE